MKILFLNDNNFQYITESICSIYDNLDSLSLDNNRICTPTLPGCIENHTTITKFYGDQDCEVLPNAGDNAFMTDMVTENWSNVSEGFIDSIKNVYTTWDIFLEDGLYKYRITKIEYGNKGIIKIPSTIANLDSLVSLELQNNVIEEENL